MIDLTRAQAQAILAAAFAEASAQGLAAASVVVTDAGGAIRAAERGDAAGAFGIDIALAKARTALGFGRASIKLAAVFGDKPAVVTGLNAATGAFLPLGGGVVIVDGEGRIIGSAGVAGGAPETDDAVASAAVWAAGLATKN